MFPSCQKIEIDLQNVQNNLKDNMISMKPICNYQGCGLGLDVSVSRRSRLGLVSRKIVNVSVSSPSRSITSRAQDQFSAKLCRPH